MRGFTYASGIASSVSTSARIGTEIRQNSSARSTRPSATSSAAVGHRLVRRRQRARLGRLDAPAELVELDQAEIGDPGLAFVAAAVLEHDETVAVGLLDEVARGARPSSRPCLSSTECRKTLRIVPSTGLMLSTNTTMPARRNSRNRPGDRSEISSRDSSCRSNSSLRCSAHGDRNSDSSDDRDQERRGEQQDRLQAGGQRLARREPDDHLAVAVPAGQRQQHRQEQRDRQQDVEVEHRVEAEQREHAVRRDRAAGRPGEDPHAPDW